MATKEMEITKRTDLINLPKGKLIKIIGKYDNGVKFSSQGIIYEPYNGFNLTIINKSKDYVSLEGISFDKSKTEVIINDHKISDYFKDIEAQNYKELSEEYNRLVA